MNRIRKDTTGKRHHNRDYFLDVRQDTSRSPLSPSTSQEVIEPLHLRRAGRQSQAAKHKNSLRSSSAQLCATNSGDRTHNARPQIRPGLPRRGIREVRQRIHRQIDRRMERPRLPTDHRSALRQAHRPRTPRRQGARHVEESQHRIVPEPIPLLPSKRRAEAQTDSTEDPAHEDSNRPPTATSQRRLEQYMGKRLHRRTATSWPHEFALGLNADHRSRNSKPGGPADLPPAKPVEWREWSADRRHRS